MKIKICSRCSIVKPVDFFPDRPESGDGKRGQCKDCLRYLSRQRFHTPRGRATVMRAQEKYWSTRKGRASQNKAIEKYRQNNKDKRNAKCAIYRARKRGEILPATSMQCEICNKKANHYHHSKGYEKKFHLIVVPLCGFCHKGVHPIASSR